MLILEDLQAVVGGDIQEIQPFEDEVALVCNDAGKMNDLPLNRAVYDANGRMTDIVAGTFFICDATNMSETFESLSEEQIQKYEKMFREPEHFYKTGSEIKVQKIKGSREMER